MVALPMKRKNDPVWTVTIVTCAMLAAPAAVAQDDHQLIIPPAPTLTEIPNKSGDTQNPLRYIDRYGLPGAGPVPGLTLGYPADGDKAAAAASAAPAAPSQPAQPQVSKPAGSGAAGGEDKQKAQQKAAQDQKKKKQAGDKKEAKKEVAASEGKPIAPPAPERPNALKDATLLMGVGKYDQALKEIEKVLVADKSNATAHYMKAVILVYRREYANAIAEYNEVQRLVPGSDLARRALEGIRKLQ